MHIDLYTDGSATTADKPGGWGYVVLINGAKVTEGSGYMPNATNNDAELEAVIHGLRKVKEILEPHIHTMDYYTTTLLSDSQLILGWINGKYSFKQQNKLEKYKEARMLARTVNVSTQWVEGIFSCCCTLCMQEQCFPLCSFPPC